jgi:hypothetical protein
MVSRYLFVRFEIFRTRRCLDCFVSKLRHSKTHRIRRREDVTRIGTHKPQQVSSDRYQEKSRRHFNPSEIIATHGGAHHRHSREAARMSHISETVDLEAEIEALIKQAGDSLRQPADALHEHEAGHGPQQIAPSPAATDVMCPSQGREQ